MRHVASLSVVGEEYLAMHVCFIYDKSRLGTPGEQDCFLNKMQLPGRDSALAGDGCCLVHLPSGSVCP